MASSMAHLSAAWVDEKGARNKRLNERFWIDIEEIKSPKFCRDLGEEGET